MDNIISKITMKVILGGDVKPILLRDYRTIEDAPPIEVALIYGFAQEELRKDKDTTYGPNLYISGEFKAKNLLNGDEFSSTQLYPPGVLHDLIVTQLKRAQPPVQFAFVVGLKYSKTSGKEYEYTIRSLIKPTVENNPFAQIESQMEPMNVLNHNPNGVTDPKDLTL